MRFCVLILFRTEVCFFVCVFVFSVLFIQTRLKGGHKKRKDAIHFSASICKQKTGFEEEFVMDFVSTTFINLSHISYLATVKTNGQEVYAF